MEEKNTELKFEVRYLDKNLYLFCGPAGSGKTTLAKLVKDSVIVDYSRHTTNDYLNFLIEPIVNPKFHEPVVKPVFILCFNDSTHCLEFYNRTLERIKKTKRYFGDGCDIYELFRNGFRF